MTLRACFPAVTLTTLILLTPCLAGEFGQTHQYFAQRKMSTTLRHFFE